MRIARWIVWQVGARVLSLPLALYTNHRYVAGSAAAPPELPEADWSIAEQQRLLDRSEQRLQGIEGKGAGLATVCAVVAAAIGVAISLTWTDADAAEQVLLIVSAVYAAMSLAAPIRLVGPIERSTVTASEIAEAATDRNPEASLARRYSQAAADNDRSTLRLSNLQAASRNDLTVATALFIVWAAYAAFAC